MRFLFKLISIGFIGGVILIAVLKLVMLLTGNTAYILLFNFDYIPWLNNLKPEWVFGYVFHFVTCICSVIGLYYILKIWNHQYHIWLYVIVYSLGGGALFFLTELSPQPPAGNDIWAWIFWTLGHAVFGLVVGLGVKWLKTD